MPNKVRKAARQADIGQSAEDYLEAVLVLEHKERLVRVTGLARHLGVSKPSVVSALAGLDSKGLVRHERYGAVELTDAGRQRALETYRRHRLLRGFLEEVLQVTPDTAEKDACRMEHDLSPETVERLLKFVDKRTKPAARKRRSARKGG